jgi:hypothetical protein
VCVSNFFKGLRPARSQPEPFVLTAHARVQSIYEQKGCEGYYSTQLIYMKEGEPQVKERRSLGAKRWSHKVRSSFTLWITTARGGG